jgi:AcrR family transcriptional regulator
VSERGDGRSGKVRPGRAPAASREAVLAVAKASYLKRVDVQAIARELGLGRVTMYRWFQTREGLLGEAIAETAEERLLAIRARVRRRGAEGLLELFDRLHSGGEPVAQSAKRAAVRSPSGKLSRSAASKLSRAASGGVRRATAREVARVPAPAAGNGTPARSAAHKSGSSRSR